MQNMQLHDEEDPENNSLDRRILETALSSDQLDQVTLPSLPSLTELQATFLRDQESVMDTNYSVDGAPSEAFGTILQRLSEKYGVTSDDDDDENDDEQNDAVSELNEEDQHSQVSYVTSTTDALLLSDPRHGLGGAQQILSVMPPQPDDGEQHSNQQQQFADEGATHRSSLSRRTPMEPAGELSVVSGRPRDDKDYEEAHNRAADDRLDGLPTCLVLPLSSQSFRRKQDPDAARSESVRPSSTATAKHATFAPTALAVLPINHDDAEVATEPSTPSPTSEKYDSIAFHDETDRSSSFFITTKGSGCYMKRSVGGSNKDPQFVSEIHEPKRCGWSAKSVILILVAVVVGLGGAGATIYFLALQDDDGSNNDTPPQNIELPVPSVGETASPQPTPVVAPSLPTQQPSQSPSVAPTFLPSFSPSGSPSSSPSLRPSSAPSSSPSYQPSASPSVSPTLVPSSTPSMIPTESPSQGPTASPTSMESTLMDIISNASPQSASLIANTNSPQDQAFDWLMSNTRFDQHSNSRILQRYVLAVFFYSTGGPTSWTENSGWLDSPDECFWYNLRYPPCTGSKIFLFLDLSDNNLQGSLPFELGLLTNLRQLKLSSNSNLVGSIPNQIWDLRQLETLELDNTGVNSALPSSVDSATSLTRLNLAGAPIPGAVPPELGNLRLDALLLANTFMTGDMPDEVCNANPPPTEVSWNCIPGNPCPCCTFCCFLAVGICGAV